MAGVPCVSLGGLGRGVTCGKRTEGREPAYGASERHASAAGAVDTDFKANQRANQNMEEIAESAGMSRGQEKRSIRPQEEGGVDAEI